MTFNVGVNVLEVDGKATPSIQAAPTSVTAFIIRAQRGTPGEVIMVTSPAQFREHFGRQIADGNGAFAVNGFFDNGGTVAHVTRIAATNAAPASREFNEGAVPSLKVTAAYRGTQDPGIWGDSIDIRIAPNAEIAATYDLFVRYNGAVVETWSLLNHSTTVGAPGRHPVPTINDPLTGSKYIIVSEDALINPDTTDVGKVATFLSLQNGTDSAFSSGDVALAATAALDLFDTIDVQLLCCPETTASGFVNAALTKCAGRGDCMFVGHTPAKMDKDAAKAYGKGFQGEKIYGALYWPWIQVLDPLGSPRFIPPTGHVLGVYARTERERGVWKAPAGNAARLGGALDVQSGLTDVDHTDLVKNGGVNAIRFISGQGIVIDSSRTLSTSPLWLYVNVRLLFNFVKTSLKYGLRWVVQEPNTEELWNKVKFNSVTPFLMGLWRRGAFGPGKPEQVFTVKCDADTNPPANIQQGIFTVEVYFYPSRPAETVVIVVGQQEGAGSANEGG